MIHSFVAVKATLSHFRLPENSGVL